MIKIFSGYWTCHQLRRKKTFFFFQNAVNLAWPVCKFCMKNVRNEASSQLFGSVLLKLQKSLGSLSFSHCCLPDFYDACFLVGQPTLQATVWTNSSNLSICFCGGIAGFVHGVRKRKCKKKIMPHNGQQVQRRFSLMLPSKWLPTLSNTQGLVRDNSALVLFSESLPPPFLVQRLLIASDIRK